VGGEEDRDATSAKSIDQLIGVDNAASRAGTLWATHRGLS
jgi:hypothetical protein